MVRRIAIAAVAGLGLAASSASACPEGITLFDFHEDPPEPISTATIIVGTGYTDLGLVGSIAVGYVAGERSGWLFRGAHVKRVLVGAERRLTLQGLETDKPSIDAGAMDVVPTRFTATFGWFDDALFDLGLDVGFTATTNERMGALGRLTLGSGGVGVRLTFGGDTDGDNPDFMGGIDLVFDLAKMGGRI